MEHGTIPWGSWMGAWKTVDVETERLDRQQAALGGESFARIKDLNVLVLGCAGVGVETSKNLILTNVGSLTLWDPTLTTAADLGTNFYLTLDHVQGKVSRAQGSLDQLKSLNPFCKVHCLNDTVDATSPEILSNPNVAGTGKPFSVVLVTSLSILPLGSASLNLYQLNDYCRSNGIAFVLACNHGVTSSIFSDFGTRHEITDPLGEPTKLLAISNVEVVKEEDLSPLLHIQGVKKLQQDRYVILITVAQSDHGLDDGSVVVWDDMRDPLLQHWNGKEFTISRVSFQSPTAAQLDTQDVAFTEILKQSTQDVLKNFEKQYHHYKKEWEEEQQQQAASSSSTAAKNFPVRTITMFNRLAIIIDPTTLPSGCNLLDLSQRYQSGGSCPKYEPVSFKSLLV